MHEDRMGKELRVNIVGTEMDRRHFYDALRNPKRLAGWQMTT